MHALPCAGFKLGLCSQPSVHAPDAASLLYLANSVAIADTLSEARARAARLFRVHAHLHHYTQYIEVAEFLAADEAVADVVASYDEGECLLAFLIPCCLLQIVSRHGPHFPLALSSRITRPGWIAGQHRRLR